MRVRNEENDPMESAWDADRVTICRHFLRDMEGLWGELLRLAAMVESALGSSIRTLCDSRADLVSEVAGDEAMIDRWEVRVEQMALKILALHQPVASDLRRVAAALRINNDLERMADLADHIAKRSKKLAKSPSPVPLPLELEAMAAEALQAVRGSLDALARSDADLARSIIEADRQIDRQCRDVRRDLKQAIRDDPDRVSSWLRLINTARNLERIADHATNIAEAVVYIKEGKIIRHDEPRVQAKG